MTNKEKSSEARRLARRSAAYQARIRKTESLKSPAQAAKDRATVRKGKRLARELADPTFAEIVEQRAKRYEARGRHADAKRIRAVLGGTMTPAQLRQIREFVTDPFMPERIQLGRQCVHYMLWVEGTPSPQRRHDTIKSAKEEAERLCKVTGKKVYLLGDIATVEPTSPPVKWTALEAAK